MIAELQQAVANHAPAPWGSSGISPGLPASSTGMSMKQLKDHSRRSTADLPPSTQVTALTGLQDDM
ncbi:hypothetical protein [Streptomyces eurythermus]